MPLSDEQIDVAWLSADDSITTYEHFRRHVARAIESAVAAPLLAQIAELEAQLLEAKKDAERYRWLKNDCNDKQTTGTYIAKELFGFEWDRAIDAAIAQEQK